MLVAMSLSLEWTAATTEQRRRSEESSGRPNIVLIMGDDLGYCDVGLYGCRDIPTPNIDSIGKQGVTFTNGYVTAPVCSPSRAALVTGRYQQRFGFEFNAGPLPRALSEPEMGLPTSEITIAEALKSAGYSTAMVGKWHLGMHEKFNPTRRGFDEYYGFLFGANSYGNPNAADMKTAQAGGGEPLPAWPRNPRNPIYRNQTPVTEDQYLTDAFARESTAFIERNRQRPFFLYAPFNAPHTPLQAPQKYYDRFPGIKDERRRVYAAMVSALDDAVGAILGKLREAGVERNTLVIFMSDNGCATYTRACTNDPLRYGKLTHLEGGFRVPLAMQWPAKLKAGHREDRVVSSLDIFPTAVGLAGASLPKDRTYDGVDLLPFLTGQKTKTTLHEVLCWRNGDNGAVRKGNWKLYKAGERYWLFDLSKDLGEKQNLADRHPEIVEQLKKEFRNWEAQLKQPMWPCREAPGDWVVDGVRLRTCI
jgi:arylsulfatase A-like enzyme